MCLSNWVSIASAAIALVSFGVAVASAWFSKKQVDAAMEANRISAAALDVSRQQLALERDSGRNAASLPYVPPWRLSWVKGDMYALTNGGSGVEHDVHVSPPAYSAVATEMDFPEIGPMSSVTFMLLLTEASPNRNVKVTWRHAEETDTRSWNGVLPPRG